MTPESKSDLLKVACTWCVVGITNTVKDGLNSVGIHNWGEASQAAAFLFSCCLILDFFWRKVVRRILTRLWPQRFPPKRNRRSTDFVDSTDNAPLGGR